MNSLKSKNIDQLKILIESLNSLNDEDYSNKIEALSGASIGQHFRHIIEFYQILRSSSATKNVNYDNRKRLQSLEDSLVEANKATQEILEWLNKDLVDFDLQVSQFASQTIFKSSFMRELQYVYEHTTHHMAIIKIGMRNLKPEMPVNSNFGVADSTIAFQNK